MLQGEVKVKHRTRKRCLLHQTPAVAKHAREALTVPENQQALQRTKCVIGPVRKDGGGLLCTLAVSGLNASRSKF